jgi:hypothetical protein
MVAKRITVAHSVSQSLRRRRCLAPQASLSILPKSQQAILCQNGRVLAAEPADKSALCAQYCPGDDRAIDVKCDHDGGYLGGSQYPAALAEDGT